MSERVGTCYSMCPISEINLREKEGLLHIFEADEKSLQRKSKLKANASKMVKCFNRPAAGRKVPDLSELRPGPVLLMTIRYLFNEVAVKKDCDWIVVYDFIFDRLRAIRQDMVIQTLDLKTSICIYEKIVRFHIYSEQRLCERDIHQYDSEINVKHLMECIEQLLLLYDEYEKNPIKVDLDISENTEAIVYNYDRTEIESVFILLRMGQDTGLNRGLSLPKYLRQSKDIQLALQISFAWYLRNYVTTCSLLKRLSPLYKCAALCNLRFIRREALMIMSAGYSSKNLKFPVAKLQELLLYRNKDKIALDCKIFNLKMENEHIHFQKLEFKKSVKMANPERIFSEKTLHSLLPNILLREG